MPPGLDGGALMIGRVLCRVGLHRDRRVRLRSGEQVYRCLRCERVSGKGPLITLMGGEGGGL